MASQTDGDSEFLGKFRETVVQLKLPHYFHRPNYPHDNGQIERSFRTDEGESYQVKGLPVNFGGFQTALLSWDVGYEQVRPNQTFGYKTPQAFYREWMDKHLVEKEALSDIHRPTAHT